MKSYKLIFLFYLSFLVSSIIVENILNKILIKILTIPQFVFTNAAERHKNSKLLENQINTGYVFMSKISEFYKNRYIGSVYDSFTAKKDVFVYFKERMNNRSALLQNIINDANDYRSFTTNINNGLDSAIKSTKFDINDLKEMYITHIKQSNLNMKNSLIDATEAIRNIIDTNITAYKCYMNGSRYLIPNELNAVSTVQKKTYKSSIATKIKETAEFVENVKMLIASMENKLDFCIGEPTNSVECLNNYVSF